MKIKQKLIVAMAALSLVLVPALAVGGPVYAENEDLVQNALCSGANNLEIGDSAEGDSCRTSDKTSTDGINSTIAQIINIFSTLVGVVAVIMIIWGGLRYITSGGDSGKIGNAKNTIIYALLGLIVVALAQFIVRFVLTRTTAGVE